MKLTVLQTSQPVEDFDGFFVYQEYGFMDFSHFHNSVRIVVVENGWDLVKHWDAAARTSSGSARDHFLKVPLWAYLHMAKRKHTMIS